MAFAVVVAHALVGRQNLTCRCFGAKGRTYSWRHLLRNVVLVLATLAAWHVRLVVPAGEVQVSEAAMCLAVAAVIVAIIILNETIQIPSDERANTRSW